ncbi:N-acetyl-gamma-glutamyl-phosphate reductase [Chlorobium sp. N1]|uniref:N-acetyl-gamma-glutamyl-phosphate reductase n=1 Tax=Chlorobium sp. N1 TaxID=2491138 RepID=UPI00103E6CA1|nr:N-acetyl-gamma-glutamyl-phosphate reductase [Chlorobium sp. N1]TCD47388.1 N-acetyl-gamma-glutamyl-phosphate reductase [Chlorobium sp. N1]
MHESAPGAEKLPGVSIIGASGYSGAELTRLILRHPAVRLERLYAFSQAGKSAMSLYPATGCDMTYHTYEGETLSDIYFLALPHGEAHAIVPRLQAAGRMVVDLSGDFRLRDTAEHERFYGGKKPADAVMTYAMPELSRKEIAASRALSNPGCYATAIILGLAPLFDAASPLPKVRSVACAAMSGLSGAGRSSKTELSFAEMGGNIRAYKVGMHQHTPEIMQALGTSATNPSFDFSFTPLIGPLVRGIYATLTVKLEKPVAQADAAAAYEAFYRDAPFTRVRRQMPEVRHVAHTNYCDVFPAYAGEDGTLTVVSTIDNLLKGAAGQAVENMNIMLGIDQTSGL